MSQDPRQRAHVFVTGGNPLVNALVVVCGFVLLGAALLFGFVLLAIVLTAGAVLAAIVGLRLWWLRRKLRRAHGGASPSHGRRDVDVIDVEYHEVRED